MKLGTLIFLAVGCLVLSGCSGQVLEASQSACESLGFVPGTDAYSQCVHDEANMRDDAVRHALVKAKAGLHGPDKLPAAVAGGVIPGQPVLKSSYVSGADRICLYNQAGNEVSIKVGANAVCPQTLQ
jgi:hypothetical protein